MFYFKAYFQRIFSTTNQDFSLFFYYTALLPTISLDGHIKTDVFLLNKKELGFNAVCFPNSNQHSSTKAQIISKNNITSCLNILFLCDKPYNLATRALLTSI